MMHPVTPSTGLKSKYPEWVVLVVTVDRAGQVDVMPAGWAMNVSARPFLFAVSVSPKRHTHKLLREGGEFVISVPGPGMEETIQFCGSHSGCDTDKVAACNLEIVPATQVKPPLLVGARVNMECVITHTLDAGDHTIFVGEVVAAHEDDDVPGRLMNFAGHFALATPAT